MSSGAVIRLVMAREMRARFRSRAFAITTALLCAGILVAGVLNRVLSGDDGPLRYDVAVVGEVPEGFELAVGAAATAVGIEVRVETIADRAGGEAALRDGDLDGVVDAGRGELVTEDEPAGELSAVLDAGWRVARGRAAAEAAGLDDDEVESVLAPAPLASAVLEAGDGSDDVATLVGLVSAVLLFISINAFGGSVLTGVVEEKTTGVVEVLLAHVRAHQLLVGKVLGIGVVALTQFAAALAAGFVALRIADTVVPADVWVALPVSLLWFVGGFVLYSTLFALAGSCVSRQEDAQSAAAPISALFTAAYLAVFALSSDPSSTVARVVSVIPPLSPLIMPLRVASGSASVIEIALAVALLVAAIAAMLRVAGSVYARTLLHRGARLPWRQALRMRRTG